MVKRVSIHLTNFPFLRSWTNPQINTFVSPLGGKLGLWMFRMNLYLWGVGRLNWRETKSNKPALCFFSDRTHQSNLAAHCEADVTSGLVLQLSDSCILMFAEVKWWLWLWAAQHKTAVRCVNTNVCEKLGIFAIHASYWFTLASYVKSKQDTVLSHSIPFSHCKYVLGRAVANTWTARGAANIEAVELLMKAPMEDTLHTACHKAESMALETSHLAGITGACELIGRKPRKTCSVN